MKNLGEFEVAHLDFWPYTDVLGESDCDTLVSHFAKSEGVKGTITGPHIDETEKSTIDTSVRSVTRIPIPTYRGLGAILTAVGIDANRQRWQFDVYGSLQAKILRYPPGGGRYTGHMDTILSTDQVSQRACRKLTVLAFLNDGYTGGKFFLQMEENKFYPPQEKGNVLVFPSFLVHGVEDVLEGDRYTAVSWLVGPFFK